MSMRPEIVFLKALMPRRAIHFSSTTKGEMTMASNKSRLLRLAEWREERLTTYGPWPKRAAAIGVVGVTVLGSGVALAAWTASGTGTAAAKAGSISFVVDATATVNPTNTLHPGSTALTTSGDAAGGDLLVTLKNTSGFTVHVTQIQQNGPITVDATHVTAGCTSDLGTVGTVQSPGSVSTAGNSGVSLPTWVPGDSTVTVAPDSLDHLVTASNVLTMTTASNTNCQGATFTIPVIVTVSS